MRRSRNIRYIHYYIIGVVAVLLSAACSSTRRVSEVSSHKQEVRLWNAGECVVSRSNVTLSTSKGKNITVGGVLRMKRDDVIQLNLTYILGIQIGTLEITADSILVLSRTTRQYALFGYDEMSALLGRTTTFGDMQAVFWGESDSFNVKGIQWKHDSFREMEDGRRLPEKFGMTLSAGASPVAMTLELYNQKYEEGWQTRTRFKADGYERLTAGQVARIVSLLIGG